MDRPAEGRIKAWDGASNPDGMPMPATAFRVISVIRSSKKPQFAGTAKICMHLRSSAARKKEGAAAQAFHIKLD